MIISNAIEETEWAFSFNNLQKSLISGIIISLLFTPIGYYDGYLLAKDKSFCEPPSVAKEVKQDCIKLQSWLPDLVMVLNPPILFVIGFVFFGFMLFGFDGRRKRQINYSSRDALANSSSERSTE